MRARQNDDYDRPAKPKRKRGRWRRVLLILLVLLIVGVALAPRLLTSRSFMLSMIDRYGGLAPLKVDFESVNAGWFKPVGIRGLKLIDANGQTITSVGNVQTEKGLYGWLTGYSNLGTIRISQVEADVVTYDGTSNIEEAIKPLLSQTSSTDNPPATESASSMKLLGNVEVEDVRVSLRRRDAPESWLVNVPKLTASLPKDGEVIGPIQLQATISEIVANSAASTLVPVNLTSAGSVLPNPARSGSLAAEVKQVGQPAAFDIRAMLEHIPLDFWPVVQARIPDVPIDLMRGAISAKIAGSLVDANRWTIEVQQLDATQLQVVAPKLIGPAAAQMNGLRADARCALADGQLQLTSANVNCDFGTAQASAQMPWPIAVPELNQPWIKGAVINATGAVDLAKLAKAAETLIPMQQNTRLESGHAKFVVSQVAGPNGSPISQVNLELANLAAVANGQSLRWDDALKAQLQASAGSDGKPQFGAICSAEFCNLQGQGTVEAGTLAGKVDLDLLQKRLSQFVALPIQNMNGSADLNVQWSQQQPGVVVTQGALKTSPFVLAFSPTSTLREPAWTGDFTAISRLENNIPVQLDSAKLNLTSQNEQLTLELREPIRLAEQAGQALVPGNFTLNLTGDLANLQTRAQALQAMPADMSISGNISLGVEGKVDLKHAEILNASWRAEQFGVQAAQMQLLEPQMVGKFAGQVDTSNLAKLIVTNMTVQATSFSLGAADSASSDGTGRIGRAGFRMDVGQLMRNVQSAPVQQNNLVLPPGGAPPKNADSRFTASGMVEGTLNWQVNPQAASFTVDATGKELVFENRNYAGALIQELWNEPQATTRLAGNYDMTSGALALNEVRLQAPWVAYAGNMTYETLKTGQQQVGMKGQAVYDAAKITEKLNPWTGGQFQMAGQKTVPIDVLWTSNTNATASALAGLQAATRLGWEQARVVGIDIGPADVPVTINQGQLTTAAEIPVSGGMVRWDLASDLTASEMLLYQKPMVVLENVAITPEMCQSWLKYVTPLIADATSVEGRLSLKLDQANLNPTNPRSQTVAGQLLITQAEVGPGPLSNQIITLVQQVNAIRKQDFTQAVGSQRVWLKMPEQKIDFQMVNGQVAHQNLNVDIGDVTLSSSGAVDIDGRLQLVASMPIPDNWVEKSPLLASMRGQTLQFPVQGTLSSPQVDTQLLRQLGRQSVQQAASGLIQQQLSRGLDKLLRGAQPPAQGTPSP